MRMGFMGLNLVRRNSRVHIKHEDAKRRQPCSMEEWKRCREWSSTKPKDYGEGAAAWPYSFWQLFAEVSFLPSILR